MLMNHQATLSDQSSNMHPDDVCTTKLHTHIHAPPMCLPTHMFEVDLDHVHMLECRVTTIGMRAGRHARTKMAVYVFHIMVTAQNAMYVSLNSLDKGTRNNSLG
jgi:hypothetical protein